MPIPKKIADDRIGPPNEGFVFVYGGPLQGGTEFTQDQIPLDGRKYRCDGTIEYPGGPVLRAKFNLITGADPAHADSVLSFHDGLWYHHDEPELLALISRSEAEVTTATCHPDRPVVGGLTAFLIRAELQTPIAPAPAPEPRRPKWMVWSSANPD